MSRLWSRALAALLLMVLLPGLASSQTPDADEETTFSFRDLDFSELITSSVQLLACDRLRPSTTPTIDLATFQRERSTCWTGSGTVIRADGVILTNAHVALDESQQEPVWVLVRQTVDARSLPQDAFFARSVLHSPAGRPRFGSDLAHLDLAIIVPVFALDGTPLQPGDVAMRPLPMGEPEAVDIGDELRNIGYPGVGGHLITITQGAVAGFEPDEGATQLGNAAWIKTDATLGGGISGGTSINEDGVLIGVPTRLRDVEDRGYGPIAQINLLRPAPEGYALLAEVGLGEGIPPVPSATAGTEPANGTAADADVLVTGTIVSADSGQPVSGAWFIVLKPGIPVADFLNGSQEAVLTFATSGADGRFQLRESLARGQPYGVLVLARGYQTMREDNKVLVADNAPSVVTLPPIQIAIQR